MIEQHFVQHRGGSVVIARVLSIECGNGQIDLGRRPLGMLRDQRSEHVDRLGVGKAAHQRIAPIVALNQSGGGLKALCDFRRRRGHPLSLLRDTGVGGAVVQVALRAFPTPDARDDQAAEQQQPRGPVPSVFAGVIRDGIVARRLLRRAGDTNTS